VRVCCTLAPWKRSAWSPIRPTKILAAQLGCAFAMTRQLHCSRDFTAVSKGTQVLHKGTRLRAEVVAYMNASAGSGIGWHEQHGAVSEADLNWLRRKAGAIPAAVSRVATMSWRRQENGGRRTCEGPAPGEVGEQAQLPRDREQRAEARERLGPHRRAGGAHKPASRGRARHATAASVFSAACLSDVVQLPCAVTRATWRWDHTCSECSALGDAGHTAAQATSTTSVPGQVGPHGGAVPPATVGCEQQGGCELAGREGKMQRGCAPAR